MSYIEEIITQADKLLLDGQWKEAIELLESQEEVKSQPDAKLKLAHC